MTWWLLLIPVAFLGSRLISLAVVWMWGPQLDQAGYWLRDRIKERVERGRSLRQ